MSLEIFKGTNLLSGLILHERVREMGRKLKRVKVALKIASLKYSEIKHSPMCLEFVLKIFQADINVLDLCGDLCNWPLVQNSYNWSIRPNILYQK